MHESPSLVLTLAPPPPYPALHTALPWPTQSRFVALVDRLGVVIAYHAVPALQTPKRASTRTSRAASREPHDEEVVPRRSARLQMASIKQEFNVRRYSHAVDDSFEDDGDHEEREMEVRVPILTLTQCI